MEQLNKSITKINDLQFEFINNKKEKITIYFSKSYCDPKSKKSMCNLWIKHGFTKELITEWWHMDVYVKNDFGTWGRYNPTITKDHKINFKYLLAPTEANMIKLLNLCYKLANKPIYDIDDPAMDWDQFDKLDGGLSDKEYKKLENKARKLWFKMGLPNFCCGCNFDREACFTSSSAIHGFYFPNLNSVVRCIAFINKKPVLVYSTGE